ncbi:MAG: YgjP-like metallopeptidase domain-containing protein [Cyanobacteria bacterium J06555_3]
MPKATPKPKPAKWNTQSANTAPFIMSSVTVRSPLHLTPEQIDAVVKSKRLWIYRNLAQWQELNAGKVVREWINGEILLYLGRAYRLALVGGNAPPAGAYSTPSVSLSEQSSSLRLKAGRFYLDRRIIEEEGKSGAQKAFKAYLTAKGQQKFSPKGLASRPISLTILLPKLALEPQESKLKIWAIAGAVVARKAC